VLRPDSGSWPTLGASWSHSYTSHSVGLLWTSNQPDAQPSTWQHTTFTTDIHVPARFELTVPASERLQTQWEEPAIHAKHINTLCEQNVELLNITAADEHSDRLQGLLHTWLCALLRLRSWTRPFQYLYLHLSACLWVCVRKLSCVSEETCVRNWGKTRWRRDVHFIVYGNWQVF